MTEQRPSTAQRSEEEVRESLELIRRFHGSVDEDPTLCPGVANCDHVNCEVCRANKRQLDSTDTYRHGKREPNEEDTPYYGSVTCKNKKGVLVGYMKPGE